MSSFPFDRVPVELQLLVWHHARASIGQEVIKGGLSALGSLCFSEGDTHRIKDYITLLSICHLSRQEALDSPLVFFCLGLNLFDHFGGDRLVVAWQSKAILGGVCTDIILHDSYLRSLFLNASSQRIARQKEQSYEHLACKELRLFFGPNIQRLHIYGNGVLLSNTVSSSRRTDAVSVPVTTFHDVDGLDFTTPRLQRAGFREVVRMDAHGVISQNIARPPLPALSNTYGMPCLNMFVKAMSNHFPDSFEYVSVVSPRANAAEHTP